MIAVDPLAALEGHAPEVVQLAEEVSLAVMVDPALLRRARLERVPRATAATEADLWFSPLVRSRSPDGFVFAPEAARALRGRLAAEPGRLQGARDRVAAAHAHLSPALRLEEELLWLSCRGDGEARARGEELLRSAVAALVRDGRAGVANWAARALPAVPDLVRGSEAGRMLEAGVSLRMGGMAGPALEDGDGALPGWLRWVLPQDLPPATLHVRLLPEGVEVGAGIGAGGHPVQVPGTGTLALDVAWLSDGPSASPHRVWLRPGEGTLVPGDPSAGVRLASLTGEAWELRLQRPSSPSAPPARAPRARRPRQDEPEHPQDGALRHRILEIADSAGARRVAVAWHDYERRRGFSVNGDEWFHAASLIKLAVLPGVFDAIHRGDIGLDSRVHVRNRFTSVGDGSQYRVAPSRDANAEVHRAIGRSMRVSELAYHMITTSSNLATNLLIDAVGLEELRATLARFRLDDGIELRRGVEDEAAYEMDINNRCTADGVVRLLRLIEEGVAVSVEASAQMLEIMHDQAFRSGIPAGLPDGARVANKTGEISTVAHDSGIVYLPRRKPYALAVLTEWDAQQTSGRSDTIARISRAVYQHLTGGSDA